MSRWHNKEHSPRHTSPVSTLCTWHNADCLCCRYHRCEFSLALERAGQGGVSPVHMSPYSKWEGVAGLFNPAERPVVLNRASSTNTTNPFGSTFCYGYQDIIFEVCTLYFLPLRSSPPFFAGYAKRSPGQSDALPAPWHDPLQGGAGGRGGGHPAAAVTPRARVLVSRLQ